MGLAEIKNDVKTLFLILNTIFGLLPGFLSISAVIAFLAATSSEVYRVQYGYDGPPAIVGIVLLAGILILAVTVLGYCGAIKENKVMLYIYSGILAVAAVGDFVALVVTDSKHIYFPYTVMMILDLAVLVLTLTLAMILARMVRRSGNNQGCVLSPAPAPYTPNI